MDIVGSHDDVDPGSSLPDDLAVLLSEATRNDDLSTGTLILPLLQHAEIAVQLVVGVLPDATGVENHDIGIVIGRNSDQSARFEETGDPLRVVLVHLASVGAHDIGPTVGLDHPLEATVSIRSEPLGNAGVISSPRSDAMPDCSQSLASGRGCAPRSDELVRV